MTRSVLLLGLGQIGMGYDIDAHPDTITLTHARAFHEHPAFVLSGGVDIDAAKRKLFTSRYAAPSFVDLDSALSELQPDIAVIATPTATHREMVEALLARHKPQAILCEKPLAYELKDAQAIVTTCASNNCALYVNYMRDSEPGALEVKQRILDGHIKSPIKGVVWYSKGIFNNGSHFLNLLRSWLGEVLDVRIYNPGRRWDGIDPEPDFCLSFTRGEVTFLAAKEENFSHYTIELIATNGRLRYEQEGAHILWQEANTDPVRTDYAILEAMEKIIESDFDRTLWHVANQMVTSLDGKAANICSGDDALRTLEILNAIAKEL